MGKKKCLHIYLDAVSINNILKIFIFRNILIYAFTYMLELDVPGLYKATLFDHLKQHDVMNAFQH